MAFNNVSRAHCVSMKRELQAGSRTDIKLRHGFAGVLEDANTQQSAEILQLEAGTMQLQAAVADNTRLQHEISRLQKVQPYLLTMALP